MKLFNLLYKHLPGQHDQSTHGRTGVGSTLREGKNPLKENDSRAITIRDYNKDKSESLYEDILFSGDINDSYAENNKITSTYALVEKLKGNKDWEKFCSDWGGDNSSYFQVHNLIKLWSTTSGDTHPPAVAMQIAVAKEFGLKGGISHLIKNKDNYSYGGKISFIKKVMSDYKKNGGAYRAFARAQYDETQEVFKKAKIKEIMLFRGVAEREREIDRNNTGVLIGMEVKLQPASSFSTRFSSATNFSNIKGTVYATIVSTKRILSTPVSGIGCTNEREVVVLGGKSIKATGIVDNQKLRTLMLVDIVTALEAEDKRKKKSIKKEKVIDIDKELIDADWTKQSWDVDIPKYGTEEFNQYLKEMDITLEDFKHLPVYYLNYNDNGKKSVVYKVGTSTSGNFGHSGRPGQVGGSSTTGSMIAGYPKDAKDITSEQAMAQANYTDIKSQMKKNLSEIKKEDSKQIIVKGELNNRAASDIEKNMKSELSLYSNYLAGDTNNAARDYIDAFRETVNKGIQDGSLKDIKAEDLNKLAIDNVQKLIYQEVESNRQQFTDHGIRHITGDIARQREIMRELNPNTTGKEELMGDTILINHDIGYTTPLIREGGERGVMMTKQHQLFSEKIMQQQKSIWNEDKIFSSKEYNKITNAIKTHDSTKIDKNDALTTSVRLSDNLSLFSKEKLPGVFKYVSGGETYLMNMGIAAKNNDTIAFEKHRKDLYNKINDANISPALKRDLKAATKEISYLTPKFSMGVLAGEISSIKKDSKSGKVNIGIQYNDYDAKMQKLFDMGQKQTKKFFEDYGITDYSKTEYDIGDFLRIKVDGYSEGKKITSLFDIVYKGNSQSGNFGHSGRPGLVGGSGGGGSTVGSNEESFEAFHGTHNGALESILKNGIVAGKGSEGRGRNWPAHYYQGGRTKSVFIASDKDLAIHFSKEALEVSGDDYAVIFQVGIPKKVKVHTDEKTRVGGYYVNQTILPEWIKGYDIYWKRGLMSGGDKLEFISHTDIKGIDIDIYYIPIMFRKKKSKKSIFNIVYKIGTATSGNRGHVGRPGLVGGSGTGGNKKRGSKEPITENDKILNETASQMNTLMSQHQGTKDWKYRNGYDLIEKEGVFFESLSKRPKGVIKGEDKKCYTNATRLALSNPEYTYVEGMAMIKKFPGVLFNHAWCIDKQGKVVETTWKGPGTSYKGIAFSTEYLITTITKNKQYGLIPDMPRGNNYNPLKNGFSKVAFTKAYKVSEELLSEIQNYPNKEKDNEHYHYIEDYISSEKISLLDILTKGGSGSGNYDGPGRPRFNKRGLEVIDEKYLRKNPQEVKNIKKEMSSWKGNRKSLALFALDDMSTDETASAKGMIIKDKKETVGIIVYENSSKGNYIHLAMVATKRKGYGRDLVKDIVEKAVKKEMGVKLYSDLDAIDFYDAIGVKPKGKLVKGSGRPYGFTYNEAKAWLALQKKMYEEVEPESGIFVNDRGLKKINIKEVKLFDMIYKIGTARSGNRGHSGRPGIVGGSGIAGLGSISDKELESGLKNTEKLDKLISGSPESNKKLVQKQLYEKLKNNKDFKLLVESVIQNHLKSNGIYDLLKAQDYDTWYQDYYDDDTASAKVNANPTKRREEIGKGIVGALISSWANTSGDHDKMACFLQHCAKQEFDLSKSKTDHLKGEIKKLLPYKKAARVFLRAQYELTQEYLKKNKIDSVILFRGVDKLSDKLKDDAIYLNTSTILQPTSSFSTRYNKAQGFGNKVIAAIVPRSKILSIPKTGFGCTGEKEVVIIGGKVNATISTNESSGIYPLLGSYLRGRTDRKVKSVSNIIEEYFDEEIDLDADLFNADWTKQSWDIDIPKYGTEEFTAWLKRREVSLEDFKKLPLYQLNYGKNKKKEVKLFDIVYKERGSK